MTSESGAARLPDELGAVDQLLHRGEANPRTRSGIMALEVLDTTPDWERYRATYENASRRLPRLRQKVVMPTLPTAAPRWVVDPDFNFDYHVRRVRLPEPGTLRQVFDMADVILQSPLDISRPLWSVMLIEGLEGGRAVQLLHMSHAVADGVGIVQMFGELYDLERDAEPRPEAPLPIPEDLSPNDLMRQGISDLPGAIVGGIRGALSGAVGVVTKTIADPGSAVTAALNYAGSGRRSVRRAAEPSPLLLRRSLTTRTEAIDMKLSDFHRAAKAAGGSINDAYLAALCGALGRYHEALGVPIATLPMAVPVNLRSASDPAGRQPIHRGEPGRTDRHQGSGSPDPEDPHADDAAPRGRRIRRDGGGGAGGFVAARCGTGIDDRLPALRRHPGQQRPGVPRRHVHRRSKGTAPIRNWAASRVSR